MIFVSVEIDEVEMKQNWYIAEMKLKCCFESYLIKKWNTSEKLKYLNKWKSKKTKVETQIFQNNTIFKVSSWVSETSWIQLSHYHSLFLFPVCNLNANCSAVLNCSFCHHHHHFLPLTHPLLHPNWTRRQNETGGTLRRWMLNWSRVSQKYFLSSKSSIHLQREWKCKGVNFSLCSFSDNFSH